MGRVDALRTFLTGPGTNLTRRVRSALEEVGGRGVRGGPDGEPLRRPATAGGRGAAPGTAALGRTGRRTLRRRGPGNYGESVGGSERAKREWCDAPDQPARCRDRAPLPAYRGAPRGKRRLRWSHPRGLTEEKLAEIYRGDPQGTENVGNDEQTSYPDPARIAEGRDGVAAH